MSRSIWAVVSCFSLRSLRLAFSALPDFFAECTSCGDLSAMALLPRRGARRASWRARYARPPRGGTCAERPGSVLLRGREPVGLRGRVGLRLALGPFLLDRLAGLLRHRLARGLVGHGGAPSSGAWAAPCRGRYASAGCERAAF